MNKEQIKSEFDRWIDADRPSVWVKYADEIGEWNKVEFPCWNSPRLNYIVDDKFAELRKLQTDEPNTQFQLLQHQVTDLDNKIEPRVKITWVDCEPDWDNLPNRYRVKPLEWYEDPSMKDKPIWVKSYVDNEWEIDIFLSYHKNDRLPFNCLNDCWKYAKPVKPEDLYGSDTK